MVATRASTSQLVRASRLAGLRLSSSLPWKVARVLALVVATWFTASVILLGVHGRVEGVHAVLGRACVLVAWLAGPLVAFWSAADRARADHTDGVQALARIHGIDSRTLQWGRGIAATTRLAGMVLAAGLPVAAAAAACAPSPGAAVRAIASVLPLAAFALGVGLTGGGLASACGAIAPRRGRTVLATIVLVPWMLDGLVGGSRAQVSSVPGLLGMLADLMTATGGVS